MCYEKSFVGIKNKTSFTVRKRIWNNQKVSNNRFGAGQKWNTKFGFFLDEALFILSMNVNSNVADIGVTKIRVRVMEFFLYVFTSAVNARTIIRTWIMRFEDKASKSRIVASYVTTLQSVWLLLVGNTGRLKDFTWTMHVICKNCTAMLEDKLLIFQDKLCHVCREMRSA